MVLVALSAVISIPVIADSGPPTTPEAFRAKFIEHARQGGENVNWFAFESPWVVYLVHQFEEGLGDDDIARSRNAQVAGTCNVVLDLDEKGFAAVYPYIADILDTPEIRAVFRRTIAPAHSFAYRRCQARRAVQAGAPEASKAILHLAICGGYKPAFRDLDKASLDSLSPAMTYAELLFIDQHAKKIGAESPALKTLTVQRRDTLSYRLAFRILMAAEKGLWSAGSVPELHRFYDLCNNASVLPKTYQWLQ